jgi:hypothetical protein
MADDITDGDFAPAGTGGSGIVQEGDDLKESSRNTLASYMSSLTTDAQNRNAYPVEDSTYIETSLRNADGSPAPIEMGGQDAATAGYTDTLGGNSDQASAARTSFDMLSNSGKFDEADPTAQPMSSFMDKNSQTDGHAVLSDIQGTRPPFESGVGNQYGQKRITTPAYAPVQQKKISAILTSHNRFNPDGESPYIEDGRFTHPAAVEQPEFGAYTNEGDEILFDELRKVATSLLLRQTGHAKADDADPDSPLQVIASLLPSGEQSGHTKITMDFLRAANAYGAPNKPSLDAELLYGEGGEPLREQKSFGALNSPLEPFTGRNRTAMLAVALSGMTGVILGAGAIAAVMLLLDTGRGSVAPSVPSAMHLGRHLTESQRTRIMRMIGIPRLRHDFTLCVIWGIMEFLGLGNSIDPPDPRVSGTGFAGIILWWRNLGDNIDTLAESVVLTSGYFANLFRTLNRDIIRFVTSLDDIVLDSLDINPLLVAYKLVTSLLDFPSFRFIFVLAVIGDIAVSRARRSFPLGGRGGNPLEQMPDTGQTRQAKSRIAKNKNELAWRHRSAPGRFILPTQLKSAFSVFDMGFGTPDTLLAMVGDRKGDPGEMWPARNRDTTLHWDKQQRKSQLSQVSRLPQEMVSQLEDQFEIEYMPFYFHDLRTNEIVGFHAFLGNIKDSYSVSYQDSSGYGRIDKVKIYQSTERSISIDFWVVSTSLQDFDSMWWSVNKLITLLYPQWSMGKQVQAGEKHFIMPFSQIPTASPMIRLRVGDVIRSNYTRFNLARLFGIAESATLEEGRQDAPSGAPFDVVTVERVTAEDQAAYDAEIEAFNERFSAEPSAPTDSSHGFAVGETAILKASSRGYTTWDTGADPWLPTPVGATHVERTPFLSRTNSDGLVTIMGRTWIGGGDYDPTDVDGDGDIDQWDSDTQLSMGTGTHNIEYAVMYLDQDDMGDPYGPVSAKGHYHSYFVLQEDLVPIAPADPATTATTLEEQMQEISDFFDPKNNAIVSSFESAGGRGLAGFITSFDMDYGDAMWDMSAMGRRAPTAMKISIAFSPIHDIPPGIDNNGFTRAINYPVGEIAGMFGTDQYDRGSASTVNVSDIDSGTARRVGGVDAGKLTRDRFVAAVSEAFGRAGGRTPGEGE